MSLLKPVGWGIKEAIIGPLVVQEIATLDQFIQYEFRLILRCKRGDYIITDMSRLNNYETAVWDFVDWLNKWNPNDFRSFSESFDLLLQGGTKPACRSVLERLVDDFT